MKSGVPTGLITGSRDELLPVIIVTLGAEVCLRQIATLKADPRIFIVLILNGCSQECVQRFEVAVGSFGICLTLPRNEGGAGGFRAGMRYVLNHFADSSYVWLLDDDAEITNNTLSELLNAAAEFNRKKMRWGVVGSMILSAERRSVVTETGASVNQGRYGIFQWNHGRLSSAIAPDPILVQYCAAASFLTTIRIIREVGIFADVFLHYDDVEWCLRVQKKGYPIYCIPRSVIYHPTHISKPATWIRYYDAANYLWLCKRYFPFLLPKALVLEILKALYFHLHAFHKTACLYWLGILHGLKGEKRLHRDDLQFEPYTAILLKEWDLEKLFITDDPRHAVVFRRRFGYNTTIILLPSDKGRSLLYGIRANFLAFFKRKIKIVIDDNFRQRKFLPIWVNNASYYNIPLDRKVKK